ncbi:MAG TPA: YggS family pyridoxal phosphate-dependent enzyme [Abditibacteriaceae bacterium]|jgi:hypothetical protein
MTNLRIIRERVAVACERANRDVAEITLVGASKKVEAERLRDFIESGLRDCGENYVQEGVAKREALRDCNICWHFIGALQSNKARVAVQNFSLIHSLDRVSLARELDKAAREQNKIQDVLLQVNVSGEASKAGCAPDELERLLETCAALPNLRITGLMALPAYETDAEKVRPSFVLLRQLRDRLLPDSALSMGMSNDFETAIEEGATHIRVGSALFGARN